EERVDEHEVRVVLDPQAWVQATRGGQDLELHGEDVLQGQPQDEDRDRDPEQAYDCDQAVAEALHVAGGEPAQRYAEPHGEQQRGHGELDGAGEPAQELVDDRAVVDAALAEVALDQLAHVVDVLLPERLVEPELGADLRHELRRRVLPQDRRGGVAGEQVDEGEQDDGQPEQDGDGGKQPANDVPAHVRRSVLAAFRGSRAPPGPSGRRARVLVGLDYWVSQTVLKNSVRLPLP